MIKAASFLVLALLFVAGPMVPAVPVCAQAAPAEQIVEGPPAALDVEDLRRARNSIAMFYYGTRYALFVVGGVVVGGYVFALLSWFRTGPTIFGSVIGSSIGIWWFLNDFAADVLARNPW